MCSHTSCTSFSAGAFQTHTASLMPRAWSHSASSALTTAGSALRSMPSSFDLCAVLATAHASAALPTYATRKAECCGRRRLMSTQAPREKEIHDSCDGSTPLSATAAALAAVSRSSKPAPGAAPSALISAKQWMSRGPPPPPPPPPPLSGGGWRSNESASAKVGTLAASPTSTARTSSRLSSETGVRRTPLSTTPPSQLDHECAVAVRQRVSSWSTTTSWVRRSWRSTSNP
mmetsp:Transcript_39916/g.128335  ORF Transcript_39916/g.128335 Transcript_39916/m.128335 type:complete len:231 (+) Transcript_39916:502-1194(+)